MTDDKVIRRIIEGHREITGEGDQLAPINNSGKKLRIAKRIFLKYFSNDDKLLYDMLFFNRVPAFRVAKLIHKSCKFVTNRKTRFEELVKAYHWYENHKASLKRWKKAHLMFSRRMVSDLLDQGWTQKQIAAEMNMTQPAISIALKCLMNMKDDSKLYLEYKQFLKTILKMRQGIRLNY